MNFDFLYNEEYLSRKNNGDYYFFGQVDIPVPSWQEILDEFDHQFKTLLLTNNKEIVNFQDRYGFILKKIDHLQIVKTFVKAISNHPHRNSQLYSTYAYISLSSASGTYGRHNDTVDVWCWQMAGKTLWTVEGRNEVFQKVLEPGELIYVPRGMWHNTKPITPRAGLSFGAEDFVQNYVR